MQGYIYLTTNNINNKKYIGRKTSPIFIKDYYGSGVHLQKALNKYGKENFTVKIIEEIEDKNLLIPREMYWINYYNAVDDNNFYNHSPGGLHEGWVPGEGNIAKTAYCRKINSEKHKNKKQSQEVIHNRVIKTSGKNHWCYNKHRSEETKSKISKKLTGTHLSEETKYKIGKSNIGKHQLSKEHIEILRKNASKKVINIDTNEIFCSVVEASKKYPVGNIYMCCKGRCKTAGGYKWKYINE